MVCVVRKGKGKKREGRDEYFCGGRREKEKEGGTSAN